MRRVGTLCREIAVVVAVLLTAGSVVSAAAGPAEAGTPILTRFVSVSAQALVLPVSHTGASVSCPPGDYVLGGGVSSGATNLYFNVASSWPSDNHTWSAYVVNGTSSYSQMTVYANCAAVRGRYRVVHGAPVPLSTSQREADADCPSGLVAFGGGAYNTSTDLGVTMNSTFESAPGWANDVNDNNNVPDQITPYVVCGQRAARYAVVSGTPTGVQPLAQSQATVTCPAKTVVLGAGGYINSGSTQATLAASVPNGPTGWAAAANNDTSSPITVYAKAVCAHTS